METFAKFEVSGAVITLDTKEEVQKLQALLAAVPVNTADDFFDNLADELEADLNGDTIGYEADEDGEFGPYKGTELSIGDCGCGFSDDVEPDELQDVSSDEDELNG